MQSGQCLAASTTSGLASSSAKIGRKEFQRLSKSDSLAKSARVFRTKRSMAFSLWFAVSACVSVCVCICPPSLVQRLSADLIILDFLRFERIRGVVKARTIVPENLALVVVGQRKLEKTLHGVRIIGIAVRIVGGKHQLIAAEFFDGMAGRCFVGLDGNKTLALEILARRHLYVLHENITFALVAFVQAPYEPWQPGTSGFKESNY